MCVNVMVGWVGHSFTSEQVECALYVCVYVRKPDTQACIPFDVIPLNVEDMYGTSSNANHGSLAIGDHHFGHLQAEAK